MEPFTEERLKQYDAYEKVRQNGRWNMFDPAARRATRLSPQDYSFVMKNYSALRAQRESASA